MSPERLRPLASSASASAARPAKESTDENGRHSGVEPAEGKAWLENWLEGEEDVYDLPCTD